MLVHVDVGSHTLGQLLQAAEEGLRGGHLRRPITARLRRGSRTEAGIDGSLQRDHSDSHG